MSIQALQKITQSVFQQVFGYAPSLDIQAPGRVNLIGEHTDYNDGFVLPAAIPQRTTIELARRDDDLVRAFSVQIPGPALTYRLGEEARQGRWLDYVQGVTQALAAAGHAAHGFDLRITS